MSKQEVVAEYVDRYGDKRVIHRSKSGGSLHVKHQRVTVSIAMNRIIGIEVGKRIRSAREAAGMTLEELCVRAGLVANASPKARMWEIENCARQQAMRLGTIYAIAQALCVPIDRLMPSSEEVAELAGIAIVSAPPTLAVMK